MTEYDRKYLLIGVGIEAVTFVFARLIETLLDLIEFSNSIAQNGFEILKGIIVPACMVIAALVVLGFYKNNRDGGGTI